MKKLLLTFRILVTLAMGVFGLQKIVMPIPELIEFGMLWIEDFPAWQVRTIGALEVLGVLGLNAPVFVKRIPSVLGRVAAAGLGLTMVGAILTHVNRADPPASIIITSALFAMCVALAGVRATRA